MLVDSAEWVNTYAAGYTLQDAVRWVLGPSGETLTDDEVNTLIDRALLKMSPDQAEDFFGTIGRALQSAAPIIGQVAQTALPIVGGALGTLIAPGIGTAVGSALGRAAGGLVGQAVQRAPSPGNGRAPPGPSPAPLAAAIGIAQRPTVAIRQDAMQAAAPRSFNTAAASLGGTPTPQPSPPSIGGSAAPQAASSGVTQLLGLLNNPQLLAAIANAALGGSGTPPPLAGQGSPAFGQLMGQLATAAHEAAAEVHTGYAAESLSLDPAVDLRDSAAHARTLVRIVGEAVNGRSR